MTTLTIEALCKSFGDTAVLSDVSFDAPTGSRVAIVGPSGGGKSTLLRMIAGFDRPDSGRILLDDTVVTGGSDFVPSHRRGIGYVAQDGALFPHLTAERNIGFGLPRGRDREARVRRAAERSSLDPALLGRFPHELSGGQQQRVALARALAPEPRLILLDEPFSALDTGLRAQIRHAVVAAVTDTATTAVLVTHDQEEALSFGDRIGVLDGGVLTQFGAPADVYREPASARIGAFLGAAHFVSGMEDAAAHTVETVFGRLSVARGTSGGRVRVLIRPEQFDVLEQGGAAVTVLDRTEAGGDVALELAAGDERIRVHLPAVLVAAVRPADVLRLRIRGAVSCYPEEAGAVS